MDPLILIGSVMALGAGVVAFVLCHRDVGTARATVAAVASGVLVGASWFLVLYLALVAFFVAVVTYAALRTRWPVGKALLAAAGSYVVLAIAAVGMFTIALQSM